MDFGRFRRCSGERTLWLIGPILITAATFLAINAFCAYVNNAYLRKRAIINVLPDFESRAERMNALAETISPRLPEHQQHSDPVEACIGIVNNAARNAGIQIVAMQNLSDDKRSDTRTTDSLQSVLLATRVEGRLDHFIAFLFTLQESHRLATIRKFSLNMRSTRGLPTYEGELTLEFSKLMNKNPKSPR